MSPPVRVSLFAMVLIV